MARMFEGSGMSTANIDKVLPGFATVDTTAAGGTETGLQNNVTLGLGSKTYSDATARQYLIDAFGWTIDGMLFYGTVAGRTIHGLGGNESITGSAFGDHIHGGAGNVTLTGGTGSDVFYLRFAKEGSDTITDFAMGMGGDKLHFGKILAGAVVGGITLSGVDYATAYAKGNSAFIQQMMANGNLVVL